MDNPQTSFLNGRVLKRTLPVIEGPPPPNAPMLKRLQLRQGELAHFWNGEEPIHYLASLELRAGAVRGNHYHGDKRELVYVISGEISVIVEDIASGRREEFELQAGDLSIIDTRVAHAYRTRSPGLAVEFSNARFDASDVHPWPLFENT